MRVQPRSHKKTITITAAIAGAILVAVLLWYYAFSSRDSNNDPSSTASQNNETTNGKKDGQKIDTKSSENGTGEQSVPHEKEKELPQLYEGDNVNNSNGLTGVITAKSVMGDNLVIRNTIDQMVSGGTCELTLTSDSKTVIRSAEIIQNPSSSACAGFDIPVAELSQGTWSIEIKVSSGDKAMTLKETVNI